MTIGHPTHSLIILVENMSNSSETEEKQEQQQQQQPLNSMLSQLSFSTEIPKEKRNGENSSVFNGLLCMSRDADGKELYYDAQQGDVKKDDETEGGQTDEILDVKKEEEVEEDKKEVTAVTEEEEEEEKEDMERFFVPLAPPEPPSELPERFLRCAKGDPEEGRRRYDATVQWRKDNKMNTILVEPHPHFEIIKKSYPHYFHRRSHNGEPVYYENPPRTNLQAMKGDGVTMEGLLRHYAMVTEFEWNYLERDDNKKCITVIDLDGMRFTDFVGDCVTFVRECFSFTGDHFPERAGFILVINTPFWFQSIWNILKPWIDPVTLQKIDLIRGKEQILEALLKLIPLENIPPEYGGKSMPLGQSPEEESLRDLMRHNLQRANGDRSCGGRAANPPCPYCSFVPARSY